MDGAISIKINKDQTVAGQAPDINQSRPEPGKPTIQNQAINTALISAGKQIMTQGVQQYADLTGNYAVAESINNVLSIGGDITTVIIGGGIGAIAVGSKYLINIGNSFIAQTRARQNIDLLRQRTGFVSTQGSRYSK